MFTGMMAIATVATVATVATTVTWSAWPATTTATTAPPGRTPLGIGHETLQRETFSCLTIGILSMGIET
jgi:hypothetical protein